MRENFTHPAFIGIFMGVIHWLSQVFHLAPVLLNEDSEIRLTVAMIRVKSLDCSPDNINRNTTNYEKK
jgi:hypothetical protein